MKKHLHTVYIFVIIVLSIGLVLVHHMQSDTPASDILFEKALVTEVLSEQLQDDPSVPGYKIGTQQIKIEIQTGPYKGTHYEIRNPLSRLYRVEAKTDQTLIVQILMKNNVPNQVFVFNYNRTVILLTLVGLFFFVLTLLGGKQGLLSILSLLFTALVIAYYLLPGVYNGRDPIMMTLIAVIIIATVTYTVLAGFSRKALAATLGTVMGVLIAGIISYLFGSWTHLSGLTSEEAQELLYLADQNGLRTSGLMFCGILIASLGAVMDVAMSITSSLFELKESSPRLTRFDLVKSGLVIGRDISGTMSNTLILAFVGGSFNTLLILMSYQMPMRQALNLDFVGTQLIQALSGSIGIVLTVPFTAFVAASLLSHKKTDK